ncbi:hypothetical protein X992_3470 [Burkholderia pseudomallei MSHR5492]|nr:hypothetical protein X992_3470 [Burkholderia pseudomallei MSHR5492]
MIEVGNKKDRLLFRDLTEICESAPEVAVAASPKALTDVQARFGGKAKTNLLA